MFSPGVLLPHLRTGDMMNIWCFITLDFKKYENSVEVNWGPLSVTTCWGKPYAASHFLSSWMVLLEVVLDSSIILGHFVCTSVTTMNILWKNDPAKSTWMYSHRCFGHNHGCKGAFGGVCLTAWRSLKFYSSLDSFVWSWPSYIACWNGNSRVATVKFL